MKLAKVRHAEGWETVGLVEDESVTLSAGVPTVWKGLLAHVEANGLGFRTMRRTVKSGILFTALTRVLGEPREMTDVEIDRWSSGPPVEVLEAGTGPAFVVVGGRRLPLRGLPLPYLVSTADMLLFPEGEEINVAASRHVPQGPVARARAVIDREGAVKGSAKLVKQTARRATKPKPK